MKLTDMVCDNCESFGMQQKFSWRSTHWEGWGICNICQKPQDFRTLDASLKPQRENRWVKMVRNALGELEPRCKRDGKLIHKTMQDTKAYAERKSCRRAYFDPACRHNHVTSQSVR